MQVAINIFITFALMFWPIVFMMSPMMLGAPGADNDKSQVVSVLLFLSYPVGISLLLWIFGGSYFGVKGSTLTIISTIVIVIAFTVFGYFGMLSNLAKGIANSGYSNASNEVYFDGKRIDGADSASFVILDGGKYAYNQLWYAKDRNHFYYHGVVVNGAIPDNLKKVEIDGDIYWLNSTQVIYNDTILPDADAESFELFEDHDFGKDKNHVYYLAHSQPFAIKDVHQETFEILDGGYLRDKNHIYYIHQYESIEKLSQIDVANFEVTGYDESTSSHARDRSHYYYGAKIVGNRN